MTIITKPSSTKKEEKAVPLVTHATAPSVLESGRNVVMVRSLRSPARQATTLILFMIALLVMCIGIIGGVMIYRQYAMDRMQRMRFHGFCKIPYDIDTMDDRAMLIANQNLTPEENDSWLKIFQPIFEEFGRMNDEMMNRARELEKFQDDIDKVDDNFLQEEVELDITDDQSYSKINVPKLKGATFLHDFKHNQTGIIDKSVKRCYFMPLDVETVLPPRDMHDLIRKLYSGYYNIDTTVLRKSMRVKVPEVTDKSLVSSRILNECDGMKIYELEKIVSGVSKRSTDQEAAVYTQYGGKQFEEIKIANLAELEKYEEEHAAIKK
jgi:integral membrane protein 2B